ncbi:MAG: hypothetical protein HY651_00775 [Acidobacteria bacterium]|nr:hypothetical protein [Acidobacteriota bacterium]
MSEEPLQTESSESQPPTRSPLPVAAVAAGIFALLIVTGIFWFVRRPAALPPLPPSEESLAYLPQVTVSDFHLSAADNLVGSIIVYLDGKVTNAGNKTVRRLRVRLYFYDTMSQLVLRQERDIIAAGGAPLAAGETRDFQLRFDRPPASWNVQPPQFQLVSLEIN